MWFKSLVETLPPRSFPFFVLFFFLEGGGEGGLYFFELASNEWRAKKATLPALGRYYRVEIVVCTICHLDTCAKATNIALIRTSNLDLAEWSISQWQLRGFSGHVA
jgi:hypothetical protein